LALNAWITSRTVSSSAATSRAIAGTSVPDADAMMIIARRTRTDSCLPRRRYPVPAAARVPFTGSRAGQSAGTGQERVHSTTVSSARCLSSIRAGPVAFSADGRTLARAGTTGDTVTLSTLP
jgi:hypothetical protein